MKTRRETNGFAINHEETAMAMYMKKIKDKNGSVVLVHK